MLIPLALNELLDRLWSVLLDADMWVYFQAHGLRRAWLTAVLRHYLIRALSAQLATYIYLSNPALNAALVATINVYPPAGMLSHIDIDTVV